MPSEHLRAAPWTAALFAIIVAATIHDARGSTILFCVAVVTITLALWIELSERIDDDT